jgi:hypothetical protein
MAKTVTTCPICKEREEPIEFYTKALNAARDSQEKVKKAEALIKEVDELLEIPGHDESAQCKAFCQAATLKKQIAEMAVKLHSAIGKKTGG